MSEEDATKSMGDRTAAKEFSGDESFTILTHKHDGTAIMAHECVRAATKSVGNETAAKEFSEDKNSTIQF